MVKEKKIFIFCVAVLVGALFMNFLIPVSAVGETSYCCEKTTDGAWCQNAPSESCDTSNGLRKVPASCEATSYCKLGTCVNSQEGTCMENTPQKVCNDNDGLWKEGKREEIPQCQLGCCLIGDQAAFVTQTRCKRLTALYGLETNFRKDLNDEVACIASATSDAKGACVFEKEFEKSCKFTTKKECQEMGASYTGRISFSDSSDSGSEKTSGGLFNNLFGNSETTSNSDTEQETTISGEAILDSSNVGNANSNVEFHEGFLCSAEELGTNCGPTEQTTCLEDRDEVYFLDSCGNLANIYDASKITSKEYWSKIYNKAESCGTGGSNANSATCGNCDYYLGSTCKEYQRGKDKVKPNYGDNICRDLKCEHVGIDGNAETYQHGETWCAESKGVGKIIIDSESRTASGGTNSKTENLPGSRYFRMVCYNGDVTVESCADFRNEVCLQGEVNGFKTAACRVNMWQDCYSQDNKKDCENEDRRDCQWTEGKSILRDNEGNGLVLNNADELVSRKDGNNLKKNEKGNYIEASCFPRYVPGFNFWGNSESSSEGSDGSQGEELCSLADNTCVVKFEKGLLDTIGGNSGKCVENCECLNENLWKAEQNNFCVALGDCGSSINYFDIPGYHSDDAIYSGSETENKNTDEKESAFKTTEEDKKNTETDEGGNS